MSALLPVVTDCVHNGTDLHCHELYGTFERQRQDHFVPRVIQDCINNENCGMLKLGSCHGCDTADECRDMGISSTLFVTHERQYMHMQKSNTVCECTYTYT